MDDEDGVDQSHGQGWIKSRRGVASTWWTAELAEDMEVGHVLTSVGHAWLGMHESLLVWSKTMYGVFSGLCLKIISSGFD